MQTGPARGGLKVAVVEDQEQIREALRLLIDDAPNFSCTVALGTMEAALDAFAANPPNIVLVDIGLPGMSGIEGTRILKQRHPAVEVIVLTVFDDDDRIFEALCAGAVGYLLKNTPPTRLLECIREVAEGGAPVSPELARRVINLFQRVRPAERCGYDLSPHELRVLRLLVEGHNYKTAAAELRLSVNTISFHMRRIYEKLQVHSKSEAVAKALRSHIIR